jgi:outer membrane protein assembly factor BamB
VLVRGGLIYVTTSNGVDKSHTNIPSPQAPSFIVLDKMTGKRVAADDAGIGPRIFHGLWSSPSLALVRGRDLVLFGGGDGFCYAFDAEPVDTGAGKKVLRTVWRCDANPPEYRMRDGKLLPYNKNAEGPSEINCTPVFYEDRVYVTVGQDSRHGPGKGALTAIDATGEGDVTKTGVVWRYQGINRSFSTPSIAGGLLFVADYPGNLHCLDARTGQVHWIHRTGGTAMGSTLVADGKVYFGNDKGKLLVMEAAKEEKVISEVDLRSPMDCTPVAAGGVLYLAAHNWLYAVMK